eukprot:TRINITY_DN2964_c0_g1_i1.p2 TRINITY_DN2964_c0_g1~~TRINITY_DN2964_c0_g1_i1.p2  ORF type:complete len:136 (+),score=21.81 TRINITY_DN2964_c0_g1_i1:103-510(+)
MSGPPRAPHQSEFQSRSRHAHPSERYVEGENQKRKFHGEQVGDRPFHVASSARSQSLQQSNTSQPQWSYYSKAEANHTVNPYSKNETNVPSLSPSHYPSTNPSSPPNRTEHNYDPSTTITSSSGRSSETAKAHRG